MSGRMQPGEKQDDGDRGRHEQLRRTTTQHPGSDEHRERNGDPRGVVEPAHQKRGTGGRRDHRQAAYPDGERVVGAPGPPQHDDAADRQNDGAGAHRLLLHECKSQQQQHACRDHQGGERLKKNPRVRVRQPDIKIAGTRFAIRILPTICLCRFDFGCLRMAVGRSSNLWRLHFSY